jgi:hypothetical protein
VVAITVHVTTARAAPSLYAKRRVTALDVAFIGYYGLLIVCHLAAAYLAVGWPSAVLTDALACIYLLGLLAIPSSRPLVLRLMTLGLVAGICELATDAAGVGIAHSLIYPGGVPFLLASPFYMPISWMVTLAWLGYLAVRLRMLSPRPMLWMSVILTGLAGAITVPSYEEMAYYAGWWRYAPIHTLGHTPVYVIGFEGAVAAILPLITAGLLPRSPRYAAVCGIALGAWMPLVAFLAWVSLGR